MTNKRKAEIQENTTQEYYEVSYWFLNANLHIRIFNEFGTLYYYNLIERMKKGLYLAFGRTPYDKDILLFAKTGKNYFLENPKESKITPPPSNLTEWITDYSGFFKYLTERITIQDLRLYYRMGYGQEIIPSTLSRCPMGIYLKNLLMMDDVWVFHTHVDFVKPDFYNKNSETPFLLNQEMTDFLRKMDSVYMSRTPLTEQTMNRFILNYKR